jgi:hypothetical protein
MRGKRGTWGGSVALVAALALALPALASASDGYVSHAGFVTTGVARGAHGFNLQFWEGRRRNFKLTVEGPDSRTTYATDGGPDSRGRVSARLGERGSVRLHFVPVGKPRFYAPPSWCEGGPTRRQLGYLIGHFAFHGERGYTSVRSGRLYAAHETWPEWRCRYATGPDRHADEEARARVGAGF